MVVIVFLIAIYFIIFKRKEISKNQYIKDLDYRISQFEKKKRQYIKGSNRRLTKLEKSEFILDYTHSFSSEYMAYNNLTEWIQSMNFKDRMLYIINSCNKNNPSIKEKFLLALAYSNLGTLYNDYAIYYIELYLNGNIFYKKMFNTCKNENDIINYQIVLFHSRLASKYEENLDYEKALKHAFMAKGMNDEFARPCQVYDLIAEILYKKGDLKMAIQNLNEGIRKVKKDYERNKLLKLLTKYEYYLSKKQVYKQPKKIRPRLALNSKYIYDFSTGEILNRKDYYK